MCFNKKVIAGLAVVAVAVLVFRPSALGAALPLLVLVACPLSMLLMMRAMGGMSAKRGECRAGNQPTTEHAGDERPEVPAKGDGRDAELTQLRAEVDQLRAEQAALPERAPDSDPRRAQLNDLR